MKINSITLHLIFLLFLLVLYPSLINELDDSHITRQKEGYQYTYSEYEPFKTQRESYITTNQGKIDSAYSYLYSHPSFDNLLYKRPKSTFVDIFSINKIDFLGGNLDLFSLNYTIPIANNMVLWWYGYIPGLSGKENKIGLTYSNKFNFHVIPNNKK